MVLLLEALERHHVVRLAERRQALLLDLDDLGFERDRVVAEPEQRVAQHEVRAEEHGLADAEVVDLGRQLPVAQQRKHRARSGGNRSAEVLPNFSSSSS
jgi:hypothetical protein